MSDQNRLWPFEINWSASLAMDLAFKTEVFQSRDGSESRSASRSNPRLKYEYQGSASSRKAQRLRFAAQKLSDLPLVFGQPCYSEELTVELPDGGTVFSLAAIPLWLTVNSFIVLSTGKRKTLAKVTSILGTAVTVDEPIAEGFPVGASVMSGFEFRVGGQLAINYPTNTVATATANLDGLVGLNYVPDEGSVGTVYEGKEVLDKKPNWATALVHGFTPSVDIVDFEYGRRAYDTFLGFIPQVHQAKYLGRDKGQTLDFVGFFMRQKGRRGDFFCPSWTDDLPLFQHPTVERFAWEVPGTTETGQRPASITSTGTHRYWRINCLSVILNDSVIIQDLQFMDAFGGADLTGSGTALSGDNWIFNGNPAKAFDGRATTAWGSDDDSTDKSIGYDFGAGNEVDIVEVAVTNTVTNDGSLSFIGSPQYSKGPASFYVEFSDNGKTWTRAWGVGVDKNFAPMNDLVTTPRWGYGDNVRVFTKDTPQATGPRRFWRLLVNETQQESRNFLTITEIEYRDTKGGADLTIPGGGNVTASDTSGTAPQAFDNVYASGVFVNNTWRTPVGPPPAQWIVYDFGEGNEIEMIESLIAFPSVGSLAADRSAPARFLFEYSDDGVTWTEAWQIGMERATITIDGDHYALFENDDSYKHIFVVFKDGTIEYNTVLRYTAVDGGTELLLSKPFASAATPDDVRYVGWLNNVRFASDELLVEWRTNNVAEFQISMQTIKFIEEGE
jgi:hypothetical protein